MRALRVAHHVRGRLWTLQIGGGASELLCVRAAFGGQLIPAACQLPVRLASSGGGGAEDDAKRVSSFGARLWDQ